MIPTIYKINTVHKGKVIKSNCILYTNNTSSVGYWRAVVFFLTFYVITPCLVIFAYRRTPDSISDGFSRWMTSHPPLTHQQSRYGTEVIAPAVIKKTLTSARGEAYLLRISSPLAIHVMP